MAPVPRCLGRDKSTRRPLGDGASSQDLARSSHSLLSRTAPASFACPKFISNPAETMLIQSQHTNTSSRRPVSNKRGGVAGVTSPPLPCRTAAQGFRASVILVTQNLARAWLLRVSRKQFILVASKRVMVPLPERFVRVAEQWIYSHARRLRHQDQNTVDFQSRGS